jgi:Exo-beta-D-glucosaminidase Ig-fold domain
MGLLIWMSHPAWPTMVWQTYDYYLEPTAAQSLRPPCPDGPPEGRARKDRRPHSPRDYTDNYIALMPGESRVIRTELENADTRGERPTMVTEGFNIQDVALN